MLTKLMLLRYHPPPPKLLSLLRTTTTIAATSTTTNPTLPPPPPHSLSLSYGPSLRKGTPPSKTLTPPLTPALNTPQTQSDQNDELPPFDEAHFTRTFELAALRVPSDRCSELERRLRGHLLNWPRVPNIARVPGDDIDEEVRSLVRIENGEGESEDEEEVANGVDRRVFGRAEGDGEVLDGVLYREKLVKEFNSRGFVSFRNLARMSRPKRRRGRREEGGGNGRGEERDRGGKGEEGRSRTRRSVMVEVVEEIEGNDGGGGDLSGLLGDEFKGGEWRGSTRLLLLDERYARRGVDELPEALKVILIDDFCEATEPGFELIRCNLTLSYDYWPMNEVLEALLPNGMIVPSAFETIGHIAHLNLRDEHLPYKKIIAKVVLDKNKPKIQTVVNKIDAISNDYRTMQLEVLSGNLSLVTTVIENGMRFQVDLATVYWNSRLATERQRLLSCFTSDDVLCDVFAGVGPIAISAAKKVKRVYANDLNPYAVDYLERNCILNKLERKIKVFNMDGRRFIDALFSSDKDHCITQVVMNLPKDAVEFLDAFRGIFRDKPQDRKFTLPMIHVYGFSRAEDPEFDFHERIKVALAEAAFAVEVRRVRLVAPGKWMLCASFVLPEKVAFAKDHIGCT